MAERGYGPVTQRLREREIDMSSGMQGVIRDALGWIAAAAALAFVIINFDVFRTLNRHLLGLQDAAVLQVAVAKRGAEPLGAVDTPSRVAGHVELTADHHGHYTAEAEVNGRNIQLMVDTGASLVVLTYEDAERAGVYVGDSDFNAQSRTANGIARNALVTLYEVCVESVCVNDVKAMVAEPRRLHVSLLGMTFLGRLRRVDIQSGRLTLEN